MSVLRLPLAIAVALALAGLRSIGVEPGPGELAFFESKVRPLLVARCYECHSRDKKRKGGLLLDTREGWQKGGDTGAALVPGKPEESLLIKAVNYGDEDLQMPPKKKLTDDEIDVLTDWVRMGAPDPRTGEPDKKSASTGMSLQEAHSYWAFQPIHAPALPEVKRPDWSHNDLDRFVLAGLEKGGLAPSAPADPRTLLRRLYFDLIGLPPTFEEMEKFGAAPTPEAWAKAVDDLLARPEYGQRWGRHWLDVARYSDTIEQSVDAPRDLPFAHTYRDYVIDAFNSDKPFPRFVMEQVAADRMPPETKPDLRALGFLTVGRRFSSNVEAKQLVTDDRIDVVGRGFLGLTLACARCHDHKFDAIPTADYYSFYSILGSCEEPMDLPEIGASPDSEAVQKYRQERAKVFQEFNDYVDACSDKAHRLLRELAPEYLHYVVESSPNHRTTEGLVPLDTPRGLLVKGGPPRWSALIQASLDRGEPFFQLWASLMALPKDGFAEQVRLLLEAAQANPDSYDSEVLSAFQKNPPGSMLEAADLYGKLVLGQPQIMSADRSLEFTREQIRRDLLAHFADHQLVTRPEGDKANGIREKLVAVEAKAPIERARVVTSAAQPLETRVMIRGDRNQLGASVSRHFLQALSMVDDRTYADDGRLQMAEALASDKNPLTARVIVNRVWQHHFGHGLVGTPDNFGAMGERPSNPELLDHLAAWFMAHGWSIKALHRYILASATWQQSSAVQTVAMEKDPANRLLWRMIPTRLEFEPMRDSLLQVAGRLDTRQGGRSEPLVDANTRRAIYGLTDRFRIPALLRNFDVANPDTSISRRAETIHPLQALYFLNSPFLRAQAEAVAQREEIAKAPSLPERVRAAYHRIFAREPDSDELAMAADYLHETPDDRLWASYVQGLLLSNEFIFCD